jgi:hypothetical protein
MNESLQEQREPDDYVEFWPAGTRAKGEFRCVGCSYGVTIYHVLPRCPNCGEKLWEQTAWSPFARPLQEI